MNVSLKISNGIRNVYWPIVFIIVIQRYISPEAFFLLNAAWVAYIIFTRRTFLWNPIWGYSILALFVLWGTIMAVQSLGELEQQDFIRDLFYYINPLVFILGGAYFCRIGVEQTKYFNSLILGNLVHVIVFIVNLFSGNEYGGISGYLWIPMALLIINRFDEEKSFKRPFRIVMIILFTIPFAVSFSRVSIIFVTVIVLFSISDKLSIFTFARIVIIAIALLFIGSYFFSNMLSRKDQEMYNEKIDNSFEEINPNLDWNDSGVVTNHWRGYEIHCVLDKFTEANPLQQLLGFGFGEQIFVGKYAYNLLAIRDQEGHKSTSIAVTHNGYANVLIKLGLLGAILLLYFYLKLIVKSLQFAKKYNKWEGRFLAGIVFGLMLMTYILNGLYKDVCYYSMVTTIGYLGYKIKYYKSDEDEENKSELEEFKEEKEIVKKGFENVR